MSAATSTEQIFPDCANPFTRFDPSALLLLLFYPIKHGAPLDEYSGPDMFRNEGKFGPHFKEHFRRPMEEISRIGPFRTSIAAGSVRAAAWLRPGSLSGGLSAMIRYTRSP